MLCLSNRPLKHTRTIAMARGLLAEGRVSDVGRMIEPLIEPVPEQTPGVLDADQLVLRSLLARVRLLYYGDAARALALLKPFDASAARDALVPAAQADVALWLGWAYTWPTLATQDGARALNLLAEAERLYSKALNTSGRYWACLGKAWAYVALDEYPLMLGLREEAAALQAKVNDRQATLWMLDLHTLGAYVEGCYTEALAYADAFNEHAEELNDTVAAGRAYAYQAALYDALGRPPPVILETATEAETRLQRAVKPGVALRIAFQARLNAQVRSGDWNRAAMSLDNAPSTVREQPGAAALLKLHRARLLLRRGAYAAAEKELDDAAAQVSPRQHRLLTAQLAHTRSEYHLLRRQWAAAQSWAERAYATHREIGWPGRSVRALLHLTKINLAQGLVEQAQRLLTEAQPYRDHFSTLPVAALRCAVLGDLAQAEEDTEAAQAYYTQALSAYTLIGDVYHTAEIQETLAPLKQAHDPLQARTLLETAYHTFEHLGAAPERAATRSLLDAWPTDASPPLDYEALDMGASLAKASWSVELIAETWLTAAARLLPDRWLGIYRCDEGQPWACIRERGHPPALPRTHEPCGPELVADDTRWIRLRSHPGPAFFFGVALPDTKDDAWPTAYAHMKPWLPVASLALDHALLRAERRDAASRPADTVLQDFVYASPAMRGVVTTVRRLRTSHSPVLLTGERGTGKARLAHLIHTQSERGRAPFRALACATVADDPLASPSRGQAGKLRGALAAADGGTLYLADIDALPRDLQQVLLDFLVHDERGSAHTTPLAHADVRLIASTSCALKAQVRDGRFLEDLFYRLNVIPLAVPPLRERREDILLLARHFLNSLRMPGTPLPTLTSRAAEAFLHYTWPGNVRQVRNEVERLLLLLRNEPAPLVDLKDLSPALLEGTAPSPQAASDTTPDTLPSPRYALDQVLAETEKKLIERVLAAHTGQVTASANALGLTRQGLYKKMKRLGIEASMFHPEVT